VAASLAWSLTAAVALGDDAAAGKANGASEIAEAREDFLRGARLAGQSRWPEALAAFERSAALRRHAVTTFNAGVCERAMGHYALARGSFERALTEDAAAVGKLPEVLVDDAHRYIDEIDGLLAVVDVRMPSAGLQITVDARPLWVRSPSASPPVLVADVLPPGPGVMPPASLFRLLVDPGAHRFALSSDGRELSAFSKEFERAAHVRVDLTVDDPAARARLP
jgi:hypothetical protein